MSDFESLQNEIDAFDTTLKRRTVTIPLARAKFKDFIEDFSIHNDFELHRNGQCVLRLVAIQIKSVTDKKEYFRVVVSGNALIDEITG